MFEIDLRRYLVVAMLLAATARSSDAKSKSESTEDRVLFVRDQQLWQIDVSGGTEETLLALPWKTEETSDLLVASNGTSLLVRGQGFTAWADLSNDKPRLRFLPCGVHAQLSSNGSHVVCETQDQKRIAVYQLRPSLRIRILERSPNGPLFFSGDSVISHGDDGDLYSLSGDTHIIAADHRPSSDLRVSPNGKRAVGSYTEGAIDVVYTFRLDGKSTKRTLMPAARPIKISASSKWVAIQQEIDACAVRIAGGQYMCWTRYEALDISSQGRSILLSTAGKRDGHDLFIGMISGTSARPPAPLVSGVGAVAAFWPATITPVLDTAH